MSLLTTRILVLVILFLGTSFFGIIPICVHRRLKSCSCSNVHSSSCPRRKQRQVTSFLINFGGGVLLATCLIHLMSESREFFNDQSVECIAEDHATNRTLIQKSGELQRKTVRDVFPLPEFLTVCGFFLIYFVEQVVHALIRKVRLPVGTKLLFHEHSHQIEKGNHAQNNRQGFNQHRPSPSTSSDQMTAIPEDVKNHPDKLPFHTVTDHSVGLNEHDVDPTAEDNRSTKDFSLTGFFTVLALSLHSVFEGFASGVQDSEFSTWMLFSAVAIHKFVIAFVVGLETLQSGAKELTVIIYVMTFAIMSPLGTLTAILTNQNLQESTSLVPGILNALSAGTLLYVTFFEIFKRKENFELSDISQFVASFIGFALMAIVEFVSSLIR